MFYPSPDPYGPGSIHGELAGVRVIGQAFYQTDFAKRCLARRNACFRKLFGCSCDDPDSHKKFRCVLNSLRVVAAVPFISYLILIVCAIWRLAYVKFDDAQAKVQAVFAADFGFLQAEHQATILERLGEKFPEFALAMQAKAILAMAYLLVGFFD